MGWTRLITLHTSCPCMALPLISLHLSIIVLIIRSKHTIVKWLMLIYGLHTCIHKHIMHTTTARLILLCRSARLSKPIKLMRVHKWWLSPHWIFLFLMSSHQQFLGEFSTDQNNVYSDQLIYMSIKNKDQFYTCATYIFLNVIHKNHDICDWLSCSELHDVVDFEKSSSSPYWLSVPFLLLLLFASSESTSSSYSLLNAEAPSLDAEQQHRSLLSCRHRALADVHSRFLTFFVKPQKRMALARPWPLAPMT